MPFKHGKFTRVFVGGTDLTAYFSEASATGTAEVAETTVFGTGAKEYVAGVKDGTISLAGLFDGSAGAVDEVLQANLGLENNVFVTVIPGGGDRAFTAATKETSYEVSSPVNDVVKTSAELQADGSIGRGPVLMAAQNITATPTNGATYDDGAATTLGAFAHAHVTANTRNGTVTVKVQHSADGTTWADLATFAAVAAATKGAERVSVNGTVNRYLRAVVTLAGTTGAATVTVALARRY
ncbi:MAG: hypothetical protein ACOYY2_13050 [Actinomycetota bacterium]